MRKAISFVFCVGTIIILVLTLISFSPFQSQTFDIFDHLRLHYFVCAGFAFFVFLWLRKTVWLTVTLLILLSNGSILYSSFTNTSALKKPTAQTKLIKLLNYNAYYKNKSAKKFIDYVNQEKPDLIVLEEFVGMSKEVVQSLKSQYVYSGPYLTKSDDKNSKQPNYIFIFSKFPFQIKTFKHWNLSDRNPPIAHVELNIRDTKIDLIAVHMHWPYNAKFKAQGLNWLSNYVKPLKNPVLLVGDFNLTPWSDTLLRFSQKNKMKKFGWFEGSWPSQTANVDFPFPHFLIDHVFVRDSAEWKINKHRFEAGKSIGSDHLPMISEFSLETKK